MPYLELFDDQVTRGELPADVQFLVRIPPSDDVNLHGLSFTNTFVFDRPGQQFGKGRKLNELSPQDEQHLVDTLANTDIVITYVSTMVIDSAVFDKPTLVISFNLPDSDDDVNKFAHYSHFKKFLSLDTVRLVESRDEFIETFNMGIGESDFDQEKRQRIRQLYCNGTDGLASQRVVDAIKKYFHAKIK
jgi:CDP-glycerol glycerophosphotransferase (TagB/SpsB family)